MQHQNERGRWVLKSPDHIFAMDALLEVYPDARLVFVHRDPVEVLASVARLTEILRKPFSRRVDRLQIGRQVAERWILGAKLLIEASMKLGGSPLRVFHLNYRSLVADPAGSVAALYRHFGLALNSEARTLIERFTATRPNGGYGQNAYRLEDYGLNPENERRRFQNYSLHFQIAPKQIHTYPRSSEMRIGKVGTFDG